MFSIFLYRIPTVKNLFLSLRKPAKRLLCHRLMVNESKHTIVSSLCESLRQGLNWDTLSKKYTPINLDGPIIEKVLLEFKEPLEAKRALSFFHWVSNNNNLVHGLKHYCITIHILARARLVNDAQSLLESILMRNCKNEINCSVKFAVVDMLLNTYTITNSSPFVFDLLVQSYSKLRMYGDAFDICCYLDKHGFSLSPATFKTLLHVIQKSPDNNGLIWEVYGHMIQKKIYPNGSTCKIMINALCKEGELQNFVDMVRRIHGKGCSAVVLVNTSLVFRMIREGKIEDGLILLNKMLHKKLILDSISYSLVIYARLRSRELDLAQKAYEQMLSSGFFPNSFVYNLFIGGYCEQGMVEDALRLMDEMVNAGLNPLDDTYNTLITGCAKIGALVESFRLCDEMMVRGLCPSTSAFNEMLGAVCQSGDIKQANEVLTVFMEKGFLPDETTFLYLIDGYGKERNFQEVLKLYHEMEFRSMNPGLTIFESLIRTLCECRKLEEADKCLAIVKRRTLGPIICIYELLIIAHLENGNEERARCLYNEVILKGWSIVNRSKMLSLFSEAPES